VPLIIGPFKSSKRADNKQRSILPSQPLKEKGQNEQQVNQISKVEELLKSSDALLKQFKKSAPKPKKEKKEKATEVHSGKGYVYTYDADGKPIPKSRVLMEEKLGRPLHEYEVIVYLDKDRRNCVIENLAIGFKANSPITVLRCDHCGTVGKISRLQDVALDSPVDPGPKS